MLLVRTIRRHFLSCDEVHFAPWTEELIDCVQADMDRAHEQGRNLVMEKYAWMMASTAPEQFKKLHHF